MTLFLTRYFLRELSAWVLFTPLVFSIFILFLAATGDTFLSTLMMVIYGCPLVFTQYFTTQKGYLTLLTIAPLPRKTIIQADFAFLSWITLCYTSYALVGSTVLAAFIHKELLFPTIQELSFLIGCCLLVITVYSWLAKQKWIPLIVFYFIFLNLRFLFPFTIATSLVNNYGFHFLAVMLALTSLSYFAIIALENRGLVYK